MVLILPGPIQARIPEKDRWALDFDSRKDTIEKEVVRRHALSRFLLEPKNDAERAEFQRKCAQDPAYLFRNGIWTKDPERRMGLGFELPLIPWSYMTDYIPFKDGVVGGGWLPTWMDGLYRPSGQEVRLLHEKGRRLLMSIFAAAFYVWAMRFYPGFKAWMSSDRDKAIDAGASWDALLGKVRFMWNKLNEFYPWLYPELPPVGTSSINKEMYIKFPEWRIGNKPVARECWENTIDGYTANKVSGRGGAASVGYIDEAGWIENLDDFLDSIEEMTPFLILGSTPSESGEHPFARRALGEYNYKITTTHWTMNPMMASGIYWDEAGEYRGPYTEQWRSPYYDQRLKTRPSHIVARNLDLDYRSTTGTRIFVAFNAATNCSSDSPEAADFDLYDPSRPLELWVDVGRRDPWACWWAQPSDRDGTINIVDYWMRSGVTAEWWFPIWLGWNPDTQDKWRTYPEFLPWGDRVPYSYGEEDLALMRKWHRRFGSRLEAGVTKPHNSLRPHLVVYDMHARQRNAGTHLTVEALTQQYGMRVICETTAHSMDRDIDKANSVLARVKLSGSIADRKPVSGGVRYPSAKDVFLFWKWREATGSSENAKPEHDIYSHGGTAFIYGTKRMPMVAPGLRSGLIGNKLDRSRRKCYNVTDAGIVDWTGLPQ